MWWLLPAGQYGRASTGVEGGAAALQTAAVSAVDRAAVTLKGLSAMKRGAALGDR
jgi:hypothetical protein